MPSLDLDANQAKYQIRSYQPGTISVNEKILTCSIIISPEQLIEDWPPQTISELTQNSFDPIIELKPTILLIGTGPNHTFISLDLYGHLINLGIGVEIMATDAACRTYNALSAENRHVIAALIIK